VVGVRVVLGKHGARTSHECPSGDVSTVLAETACAGSGVKGVTFLRSVMGGWQAAQMFLPQGHGRERVVRAWPCVKVRTTIEIFALHKGLGRSRVKMSWMTGDGDRVRVGDRVAISSLRHPDAVGEIIRALAGERIECHVTQTCGGPADFHLPVRECQLVCRLPEGDL